MSVDKMLAVNCKSAADELKPMLAAAPGETTLT